MRSTNYIIAIESEHLKKLGFSETEDSLRLTSGRYEMYYEGYAWSLCLNTDIGEYFIQDFRCLVEFNLFWNIISGENIFDLDKKNEYEKQ